MQVVNRSFRRFPTTRIVRNQSLAPPSASCIQYISSIAQKSSSRMAQNGATQKAKAFTQTMEAWQFTTAAGGLEKNLQLNTSAQSPKTDQPATVVGEVIAASVNPIDYKIAEFGLISRRVYGPRGIPGIDFCGTIVVSNSQKFQEGQRVFGRLDKPQPFGTLAQYTAASEQIAVLPEGVDPDHAAAVGTAGLTTYQCLKIGGARAGAKVFINGGSGGTGTWSIQFAKAMGCHVTTSCSTRNVELCKQLGADEVLDYTQVDLVEELKRKGQVFDLVCDNVGQPFPLYRNADSFLKPGCKFMQVGLIMGFAGIRSVLERKFWPTMLGNGSRTWMFHDAESSREDLEQIGQWLAGGKVKAVFDRKYKWQEAPEAYARLKSGKAQGKIIVEGPSRSRI